MGDIWETSALARECFDLRSREENGEETKGTIFPPVVIPQGILPSLSRAGHDG